MKWKDAGVELPYGVFVSDRKEVIDASARSLSVGSTSPMGTTEAGVRWKSGYAPQLFCLPTGYGAE